MFFCSDEKNFLVVRFDRRHVSPLLILFCWGRDEAFFVGKMI